MYVWKGPVHFTHDGHSYFYSGNVTEYEEVKVDWLEARNVCREYCMDLVSIETPNEDKMISDFIRKGEFIILSLRHERFTMVFKNSCKQYIWYVLYKQHPTNNILYSDYPNFRIISFRGFGLHLDKR